MGKRLFYAALCAALLLVGTGCGKSTFMRPVEPKQSVAPGPGMATVVFVRPSGYGGGNYAVLDGQGELLGQLEGETYFAVQVAPGEHLFVSWGEGTPALRAMLEAGKIYYVEMGMMFGAWSARARLFAIGPARKQWAELPGWLAEARMLTLTPEGKRAFLAERGADIPEVVAKGQQSYAGYDAEEKQERTLFPTDGVPIPVAFPGGPRPPTGTGPVVPGPTAPPPPVAPPPATAPPVAPPPVAAPLPPPPTPAPTGGCTKDTECKGDRICRDGACTAP